jgi:small-conductance mechanosensitive channel
LGEQDILKVTARIILPLLIGLVGMIALPPFVCMGLAGLLLRYAGIDSLTLVSNRFLRKFGSLLLKTKLIPS